MDDINDMMKLFKASSSNSQEIAWGNISNYVQFSIEEDDKIEYSIEDIL